MPTNGVVEIELTVTNTDEVAGAEVVQLYLHDPVAQTTQPVVRLVGYARVPLDAGEQARVTFAVPADVEVGHRADRGHRGRYARAGAADG